MKRLHVIGLLVLVGFLTFSCATLFTKGGADYRQARSAYQNREYVDAMSRVLTALEKNPEFEEALELYPTIYQDGSSYYLSVAGQATDGAGLEAIDNSYAAMKQLVALNRIVKESGRTDISTTDYSGELEKARTRMLEAHYNAGAELLETGEIAKARQAYQQFQFVLGYESDFKNAGAMAEKAVEAGTVRIAVDAGRPGKDGVAEVYHGVIMHNLGSNRFLDIAPVDAYAGSKMASPTDAMYSALMGGSLDYVIKIDPTVSIEKITESSSDDVPVTVEHPISNDGYYFTRGYKAAYSLRYVVKGPGMRTVDEGTLVESSKKDTITIYKIMGEVHRDIDFGDGSGSHNLIVAETNGSVDMAILSEAVAEVSEPTRTIRNNDPETAGFDQMQWKDYFLKSYPTLDELKAEYNGAYFTNAYAVYDTSTKRYYFVHGSSITESMEFARQSSAMYQGIARASTELGMLAAGDEKDYHRLMASELSNYIGSRF